MSKGKRTKHAVSCGAVVWRLHDDRVELLLIKQFQHRDSWGIPKGHRHKDESYEDCARREVREEAGVSVVLGTPLPPVTVRSKKEKKVVYSYLAQQIGNDLPRSDDPDSEVADARWFDVDRLPQLHVYQQPLIEGAVALIRSSLPTHMR